MIFSWILLLELLNTVQGMNVPNTRKVGFLQNMSWQANTAGWAAGAQFPIAGLSLGCPRPTTFSPQQFDASNTIPNAIGDNCARNADPKFKTSRTTNIVGHLGD